MAERIYTSTGTGNLEALEETSFSTEDELQALIAEHPELLDGEQIRPGDACRWILITREKGIASSSGEGARWSVDHPSCASSGSSRRKRSTRSGIRYVTPRRRSWHWPFSEGGGRTICGSGATVGSTSTTIPSWYRAACQWTPGTRGESCSAKTVRSTTPRTASWCSASWSIRSS